MCKELKEIKIEGLSWVANGCKSTFKKQCGMLVHEILRPAKGLRELCINILESDQITCDIQELSWGAQKLKSILRHLQNDIVIWENGVIYRLKKCNICDWCDQMPEGMALLKKMGDGV